MVCNRGMQGYGLLRALVGLCLVAGVADVVAAQEPAIALGQPVTDYAARRKALMAALRERFGKSEDGNSAPTACVVVVRGGATGDREDFEEGRFRQSNDFAYLTGVDLPGAYLVLDPVVGREVLYLPSRSIAETPPGGFSHRPTITPSRLSSLGFTEVKDPRDLRADLVAMLAAPGAAGDEPDPVSGRCVVYTLGARSRERDRSPSATFVRELREAHPANEFRELGSLIHAQRLIKSPAEVALLQRAIDITGQAQRDIAAALEPGMFEYQLEAKLMHAFLDGGALRPGFASIIGSGPNACIPHYFQNNRRIEDGDLVVVDIGAEYELYTADITRTYPANGKFTPRQRELYQAVLDAQTYAAQRVEPGKTRLGEMTAWVQMYFRNHPLRAKDASGEERTLDRFFIHGLGHYLGMDVHDVGDGGRPMEAGMVFTIEPGLYIPSENIGIRIEDDYLVTEDGLFKMSGNIPSEVDEIEAMMAKGRAARARSGAVDR